MLPMIQLGDEAQVEPRFSPNLEQDRWMVCAERTTGSKIILDEPNVTPR
jgi:hypothetical protein